MDLLYTAAPEIKAVVEDFNFRHVLRFLNELSDTDLVNLPTINKPSSRRFAIELGVSAAGIGDGDKEMR